MDKTLLEQSLQYMPLTEEDQAKKMLSVFVEQALQGVVTRQSNSRQALQQAAAWLDGLIQQQLNAILHQSAWLSLEGSWRGLKQLIDESETGQDSKIRVLSVTEQELHDDFARATDFDQSALFNKIYEQEFGTPGGEPYAILIHDHQYDYSPHQLGLLQQLSRIAAAAFCPLLTAASHSMFGIQQWQQLSTVRDVSAIFQGSEYVAWHRFRQQDEARFAVLTLPRVLAREPFAQETVQQQAHYCWTNAAYALAQCVSNAYAQHGWCTAIRGVENGGKIDTLPIVQVSTEDGDVEQLCPTEIVITDRREAELSELGFLPICHYKNSDWAVFFGAETVHRPRHYDNEAATSNARIAARLPYVLASSRFAHYLKIMARDKIGAFMEVEDVEHWLNRWILQYVNANANSKHDLKAKYPLAEAAVSVVASLDQPGHYQAVAWLRPWLQLEQLSSSLRLVANIPITRQETTR